MPETLINLTVENSQKLEDISTQTGKTRDELVNEAVKHLVGSVGAESVPDDWHAKWRGAAGMWRERDDLPDFQEIRRSWERSVPEDEAR